MYDIFIKAIHDKQIIEVSFYSKEDGQVLTRVCAPFDYGPRSRARDKSPCFHMWNYTSDTKPHTLSIQPEQIVNIQITNETFNPTEIVKWQPKWFIERDWGAVS